MAIGKKLEGVGDSLAGLSTNANQKLNYCLIIDGQNSILAKLDNQQQNDNEQIIENQALMIQKFPH